MDKKFIIVLVALVLSVTCTIGVTLAWLVDTTGPVTNTFTVGDIEITLDEAPVNLYGEVVAGNRRTENTYKLIPAHEYTKDPTVHVQVGSEPCWVFVKVENNIAAIEGDTTIAAQIAANDWTELTSAAGENYKVYYKENVDAREEAKDLKVFEKITIANNATLYDNDGNALYSASTPVIITAYAIQDDGLGTAADAWTALGN